MANKPVAVQGFPRGGGTNPPGGRQHTILPNFPKKCMKLKEFGPPGERESLTPPLDPPLQTVILTRECPVHYYSHLWLFQLQYLVMKSVMALYFPQQSENILSLENTHFGRSKGSGRGTRHVHPTSRSKFFHLHAVFRKFLPNY